MPRSGLAYAPELEWIFAAQWGHYRLEQFRALDGEAQAEIVAAYRTRQQIDAVLAHEQAEELKRNYGRRT